MKSLMMKSAFYIPRGRQIAYVVVIGMIAFLSWVLSGKRSKGSHECYDLGPLVLDIDHSGFPGAYEDRHWISTRSGVFYGNGHFSVGVRKRFPHEKSK